MESVELAWERELASATMYLVQSENPMKNTSHDSDLEELISALGNSILGSVQTVEELIESSLKSVATTVGKTEMPSCCQTQWTCFVL